MCDCVYSLPREVLAERYLFTPPAELMELSSSDRPCRRDVSSVRDDVLCKPKKGKKKKVRLHAGEAAARLCDSNIGRRQIHGCRRASVGNWKRCCCVRADRQESHVHFVNQVFFSSFFLNWKRLVSVGQSEPGLMRNRLTEPTALTIQMWIALFF